ncbi:hypothetical protein MtrunA17_Chr7g0219471 [Medicago truncatula]|uniref:Uncharacterized protein n=1 Tax=Medicago truncatula TaxID=3880 RepID=A0A072U755_MEDTR|nr:uncharacterized protein LOC25497545 isoform X1 [Medicago truncatula]KEH21685.1 hypothetical protein MTR_7g015060 [Medicago truncatula]RHN44440.1 hypothetical protein MtrunA17_Chr7g0219471 [Medicago truncatula]
MKNGQSLFLKFIMKLWPCCINHEPYPSYFHSHLQNTFAIVSLNSFNVTSDLFDQILKYRNDGRGNLLLCWLKLLWKHNYSLIFGCIDHVELSAVTLQLNTFNLFNLKTGCLWFPAKVHKE